MGANIVFAFAFDLRLTTVTPTLRKAFVYSTLQDVSGYVHGLSYFKLLNCFIIQQDFVYHFLFCMSYIFVGLDFL